MRPVVASPLAQQSCLAGQPLGTWWLCLLLVLGGAGCGGSAPRSDAGRDGSSVADAAGQLAIFDFGGLDPNALEPAGTPPLPDGGAARLALLVSRLAQDEKLKLIAGADGPYVGNIAAVSELPPLTLQDGPAGVARFDGVTAFPAPITLAASWDRSLVQRWGAAMAAEARGKGVMILLGPMMNLARSPQAGRNAESFGEDPFLSAELVAADVVGIQSQKVVATAKHFIGNEQETNRTTSNSVIDERALHEVYYLPFEAAVAAGAGAVMCSYNRLNGTYACENAAALGDLKQWMGFDGFVMTDWGAAGSTGAHAGLDMIMPDGASSASALAESILAGRLPQARLDDMVGRILGSLLRLGVLDDPPLAPRDSIVTSSAHFALAREAAAAGITLLKNTGALPFDEKVRSIAVIGSAADGSPACSAGGSPYVNPSQLVSPLSAIKASAGASVTVSYAAGEAGEEGKAVAAAAAADAAVVIATALGEEGYDRPSLGLAAHDDALIKAVTAVNSRTVVVLHVASAVLMPWLDEVGAVLVAWVPGEQNGNAIAPILFGRENPNGRLPVSFVRNAADLPKVSDAADVPYSEGLAVGYRGLDSRGIEPLFPFGHGLSYTTFAYSDLAVRADLASGTILVELTLANTGTRDGVEVVQLYLGFPEAAGEPPLVLRGFERAPVAAGQTSRVTLKLGPGHLSCWNPATHARYIPSGVYRIAVGRSSRDLPLATSVQIVGLGRQD